MKNYNAIGECLRTLESYVPKELREKFPEPKTIVVFKKFKHREVMAIFPEENYYHYDSPTKISYMHVGQYGPCDVNNSYFHLETVLATPEEYADLAAELTSIGYNLDIQQDYQYSE